MTTRTCIFLLLLALPLTMQAEEDWTFLDAEHHHDSTLNEIWFSADQPGFGTGSEIIAPRHLQWELGFDVTHIPGIHMIGLPNSVFRYGVHKRVELRFEYAGALMIRDKTDSDPESPDHHLYAPTPLWLGTKVMLCDHHAGNKQLRGVPRTSIMVELGLPLTPSMAKYQPISGTIDMLFENEVTEWFSIGYNLGVYWIDWAPTPDLFASLTLDFEINNRWGVFLESFNAFDPDAISLNTGKRYTHCDLNMDFGVTYAVHPRVQLDASAGFNLYNDEPSFNGPKNYVFVGLGVTWLIYHPKQRIKRKPNK